MKTSNIVLVATLLIIVGVLAYVRHEYYDYVTHLVVPDTSAPSHTISEEGVEYPVIPDSADCAPIWKQ